MPVYRYLCRTCGREWERDMPISLRDKVDCSNKRCAKSPKDIRILVSPAPSIWRCAK
jgi:predicted nucleic acid-binding Zn ribbon protein